MISETDWLAQVALTESDRVEEWFYIMSVVRNRVQHRRYPDTYEGVVTQAYQFSFYNMFIGNDNKEYVFSEVNRLKNFSAERMVVAKFIANQVMSSPKYRAPFNGNVTLFYSPISMGGRMPSWNWDVVRRLSIAGIDPARFTFGEELDG